VKPFGSIVSGFCCKSSDLDVTFLRKDADLNADHMQQDAVIALRKRVLPLLLAHPQFEVEKEVWSARVPILKLRFMGEVEVDLSCHNLEGLLNTQLLKAYADLHPKVKQMVMAAKLWAKTKEVCGACAGNLSSYSLTLMVIYFLQVDSDLQLPCFPTW
ncbi:unnamed protein product, partial [Polarella glacialis]